MERLGAEFGCEKFGGILPLRWKSWLVYFSPQASLESAAGGF
jgi:hypothetical protein